MRFSFFARELSPVGEQHGTLLDDGSADLLQGRWNHLKNLMAGRSLGLPT